MESVSTEMTTVSAEMCPAIRTYMNDGKGLLAPVGHPVKLEAFEVPCPRRSDGREHRCHLFQHRSRYRCTCGAEGDYIEYEAVSQGISRDEARTRIMALMKIKDWSEIMRTPWAEQRWYQKKLGLLKCYEFEWLRAGPRPFLDLAALPLEPEGVAELVADGDKEGDGLPLWDALDLSHQIACNMRRNSLLAAYQDGSFLYRLREQHRGGKADWTEYLKTKRPWACRRANELIRVFESVEFCWQLVDFRSKKELLKAITRSRRTSESITTDGAKDKVTIRRNFDRSPDRADIVIELTEAAVCGVAASIRPEDRPKGGHVTDALGNLLAMFFKVPKLAAFLAECVAELHKVVIHKPDDLKCYLNALYLGLRQLHDSSDVPAWFQALCEEHELAPAIIPAAEVEEVEVCDAK